MAAEFVDNLLKLLATRNGRGIRLEAGSPVQMIDVSGALRSVSPRALTRQEILGAIAPIVPEHARRQLPESPSVEFDYTTPVGGDYKVQIVTVGEQMAVSIMTDGSRASAAAPSPASDPSPSPASAAPEVTRAAVPAAPVVPRLLPLSHPRLLALSHPRLRRRPLARRPSTSCFRPCTP